LQLPVSPVCSIPLVTMAAAEEIAPGAHAEIGPGVIAIPGANNAGHGQPARLQELVQDIKTRFHSHETADPIGLAQMLFEAELEDIEQQFMAPVSRAIKRALQALSLASANKTFPVEALSALKDIIHELALDWPVSLRLEQVSKTSVANSAADAAPKKSEFSFPALRAASVVSEEFASIGQLRTLAKKLTSTMGFGLSASAVEAFARLRWQDLAEGAAASSTSAPVLTMIYQQTQPDLALGDDRRLTLAWIALSEFFVAAAPEFEGPNAEGFMSEVLHRVVGPLLHDGMSASCIIGVLQREVFGVLADMIAAEEGSAAAPVNAWDHVQRHVDMEKVAQTALERYRLRKDTPAIKTKEQLRRRLMTAAEVLMGTPLSAVWRKHCMGNDLCPLHVLLPKMCPYGKPGCPFEHPDALESDKIVSGVLGEQCPDVAALRGRANQAGNTALGFLGHDPFARTDAPEAPQHVPPPANKGGKWNKSGKA